MIASVMQEQFSNGSVGARRLSSNSVVEEKVLASLFVERRNRRSAALFTYGVEARLMPSYLPHVVRWDSTQKPSLECGETEI